MMQGLALLCALIFWAGLVFFARWTIRLHVTSKYSGTDLTPKNKDLGTTQVILQCRGPGTKLLSAKADVAFSFSAASFQNLFEDIQKIINGRLASRTDAHGETASEAHVGQLLQRGISKFFHIVRILCAGWAKLGIFLALREKMKNLLHALTRKTEVQVLRVDIRGGTGDAALTAVLHGLLWMAWGNFIAHLYRHVKVTGQNIDLNVKPDFAWVGLDLDIISIVRLKTSHIIVKGIQLALWLRRAM